MRIENYTRELIGDGYMIIGSSTYAIEPYNFDAYDPIEMSLSHGTFCCPSPNGKPVYDNLEELIKVAEPNHGESEDFEDNYAEIIRGNRQDWHLGGFCVFVGGITLYFGNQTTEETGWVNIIGVEKLWLTFKCSRTRLGFNPIYNVRIMHGKNVLTMVEEDLGYIYRRVCFKPPKSHCKNDNTQHEKRQYLEISEYTDL